MEVEPSFHQATSIPHPLLNEASDHGASPARNSPTVLGDMSSLAHVSQEVASTSLLEVGSCSGCLMRDPHVSIQRSSSPTSDESSSPLLLRTTEPTASKADQMQGTFISIYGCIQC